MELAKRARVSTSQLALKLGVQRQTLYRWLEGRNRPRYESIVRATKLLVWTDNNGEKHNLTEDEVRELSVSLGYSDSPAFNQWDDAFSVEESVVRVRAYSLSSLAKTWTRRQAHVEANVPGTLLVSSPLPPRVTWPTRFLDKLARKWGCHESEIEEEIELHKQRQVQYERRMRRSIIRHLYCLDYLEDYGQRAFGFRDLMGLTANDFKRHLALISNWLNEYPNFEVALTRRPISSTTTLVGSSLVWSEFVNPLSLAPEAHLRVLELASLHISAVYREQFEILWAEPGSVSNRDNVLSEIARLQSLY
jgi:transcriptional regulator with XRE-family HTH domain